jgi:hypothetical protein
MKKTFNYLIIAIMLLSLTNCSSSFFSLFPDEQSTLEQGRNLIEKEDDFAYSSITFEEQVGNDFVFHIFAYNKNQDEFIFDPANIYVKVYDQDKQLLHRRKTYAINPEEQIKILDEDMKEREDEHDAATGLNIVFSLFDTIADLSDDEDNDVEEVLENVVVFTGNQVNEEVSYQNDIEYLKSNKSYWKNEVLRKSLLSKEEGIDGMLYIPLNPEAKYIKVYIPIGNSTHTYKFVQIEE